MKDAGVAELARIVIGGWCLGYMILNIAIWGLTGALLSLIVVGWGACGVWVIDTCMEVGRP